MPIDSLPPKPRVEMVRKAENIYRLQAEERLRKKISERAEQLRNDEIKKASEAGVDSVILKGVEDRIDSIVTEAQIRAFLVGENANSWSKDETVMKEMIAFANILNKKVGAESFRKIMNVASLAINRQYLNHAENINPKIFIVLRKFVEKLPENEIESMIDEIDVFARDNNLPNPNESSLTSPVTKMLIGFAQNKALSLADFALDQAKDQESAAIFLHDIKWVLKNEDIDPVKLGIKISKENIKNIISYEEGIKENSGDLYQPLKRASQGIFNGQNFSLDLFDPEKKLASRMLALANIIKSKDIEYGTDYCDTAISEVGRSYNFSLQGIDSLIENIKNSRSGGEFRTILSKYYSGWLFGGRPKK